MNQRAQQTRTQIEQIFRDAGVHRGMCTREATVAKGSISSADDSDPLLWTLTTEMPATVFSWKLYDFVEEVLLMDGMVVPEVSQVPLLDSHNRRSCDDVLGHVRDFTDSRRGTCPAKDGEVYFASDEKSQRTRQKVIERHLLDGSVGYEPLKSVWIEEGTEESVAGRIFQGPLLVTHSWLLKEFSVTPVGADVLAKVRTLCGERIPLNRNQEKNMNSILRAFLEANGLRADATDEQAWELYNQMKKDGIDLPGVDPGQRSSTGTTPPAGGDGAGTNPPVNPSRQEPQTPHSMTPEDVQAQAREAVRLDIERRDEITERLRRVNLLDADDGDFARTMLNDPECSVERAGNMIFERLAQHNPPIGNGAFGSVEVGVEARDKYMRAAGDGLMMRSGHQIETPAAGATEFRGRRLADIAADCLERAGVMVRGLNPDQIASRAVSAQGTSDFPLLMANVANRNLQAAYQQAPSTYRPWVAVGDANDFKDIYNLKLSGAPDLEELTEHGEIKTADFSEGQESYRVVTKALKAKFTRVMLINDDLRAFSRIPTLIGASAKRMENKMVYALLLATSKMSDGIPLFHADHNNIGTAGDINSISLGLERAAFRQQKGLAGETLDLTPAFLLAGTKEETNADILLRSAALPDSNMSSGVHNPWAGKLTPVTDPLLDVTAGDDPFYLVADPNQAPVIEVAWLLGQEQPFVDDEQEFGTGHITYVCRHDFGCGLVDYVGARKVPRP